MKSIKIKKSKNLLQLRDFLLYYILLCYLIMIDKEKIKKLFITFNYINLFDAKHIYHSYLIPILLLIWIINIWLLVIICLCRFLYLIYID